MSNSCLIAPAQGNLGILLRWSGDFLSAPEVNVSDLKIGDIVYCFDTIYHKYTKQRVIGFTICAGYDTKPRPYVDKYPNSSDGVNFNNILVGPVRKKFTEDCK